MFQINIEKREVLGIPFLFIQPTKKKIQGTILHYYGWNSEMNNSIPFCSRIAEAGYQIIVPELPNHGARIKKDNNNAELICQWNTIFESIDESLELINLIVEYPTVIKENFYIQGYSMGGYIASVLFTKFPFIKGLIAVNSCLAWQKNEELLAKFSTRTVLKENQKLLNLISLNDPINLISKMVPRSILIFHGQSDFIIPVYSQRYFYKTVLDDYSIHSKQITYIESPNSGHQINLDITDRIIEWLQSN
ncbi:alpha/beta hydrolase [Paenibacillus tundrae]|nr:alpha/beta hydrolase [Paenibacillus tundrae]